MKIVEAIPNKGLIIDGTRIPHGTQTMMPGSTPPNFNKDIDYFIEWNSKTQ